MVTVFATKTNLLGCVLYYNDYVPEPAIVMERFVRMFRKPRFDLAKPKDGAYAVIGAVLTGQIIMASYIYTGLRFNAIYSLKLLYCFIYINRNTARIPLFDRQNKF